MQEKRGKERREECSECGEINDGYDIDFHKCYECGKVVCDNCLHRDRYGNIFNWGLANKRSLCIDCLVRNANKYLRARPHFRNGEIITVWIKQWEKWVK